METDRMLVAHRDLILKRIDVVQACRKHSLPLPTYETHTPTGHRMQVMRSEQLQKQYSSKTTIVCGLCPHLFPTKMTVPRSPAPSSPYPHMLPRLSLSPIPSCPPAPEGRCRAASETEDSSSGSSKSLQAYQFQARRVQLLPHFVTVHIGIWQVERVDTSPAIHVRVEN